MWRPLFYGRLYISYEMVVLVEVYLLMLRNLII